MLSMRLCLLIQLNIFMEIYKSFDESATKRVSFILITKNRAEYLDKALSRCRDLIGQDDELIIIDGGSTDRTMEVIQTYADIVDILLSEPDLNSRHGYNKGLFLARGRYIKQFGDDDDIIFPDALRQALEVLEKNPEIDLLLCGGTKQQGDKTWPVYFPAGIHYGGKTEDVFRYLGPASGTGHVLRRSSLSKLGLISFEDINADAGFVLHCIRIGAIVRFCRIHLYHHIIHPHSGGFQNMKEHIKNSAVLAWRYCSFGFFMKFFFTVLLQQRLRLSKFTLLKRLGRFLKKFTKRKRYAVDECIWDGGFS